VAVAAQGVVEEMVDLGSSEKEAAVSATRNDRHVGGWRLVRILLASASAAAALTLAGPATDANAGGYVVRECSPSTDHSTAPDAAYSTTGSLAFSPGTLCYPAGEGIAIGTQGTYSGPLWASWTFTAPAGAFINGVNFERWQRSAGSYSALVSVCAPGICNSVSSDAGPPFASTQFGPGGWTSFSSMLQCGVTCNAGGYVYIRELSFSIVDLTRPEVSSLGGTLVSHGPRRGSETLTIHATDQGGGVREASVRVNGSEVVARPQSSCALAPDGVAVQLRPCGSATYTIPINTDSPPWVDGSNIVEVCAYDYTASGPPNAGCTQRVVEADNSCPASGGTTPATSLDAGLEKQGRGDLRPSLGVRSTQGATLRGRLAGTGGPVSAANVCVYEQVDVPGDVRQLVQTAKTRTDGTFAVQLPPGPSRSFDVVYRYNNQLVERERLYLASSVKPLFRVGPKGGLLNGGNARFRGRIPGPNEADRQVTLQARVGRKWRTFKQVRTDQKGRFKGRYRFTQTRGTAIYIFRALVKKQGGYPFSPGSSGKRKIAVSG
jgi:hypothetical protein